MKNNPNPQNGDIPPGVAHATLILLRRAIAERNRMLGLKAKHVGLSLWMMPNGELVYRRRKIGKNRKKQPLLIHEFKADPNPSKIALVSRMITWITSANCTALADMLTQDDLADCYRTGFFRTIGDDSAHAKGRLALMDCTKRRLVQRHIVKTSS